MLVSKNIHNFKKSHNKWKKYTVGVCRGRNEEEKVEVSK